MTVPPNKHRRLQITLTPEAWKLVNEVNALTGQAKAGIISEVLDWVLPVLQNQIDALRLASEQPLEAQRIVARQANELIGQMAQSQLDLDAAIDGRTLKGKRAKRGKSNETP